MAERPSPDPLYVAARRVLLDGLEALGAQRRAAILVGAHAVYLRVGAGDLATTPHTTDADLALDPAWLSDVPLLGDALLAAGFRPKTGARGPIVGSWVAAQEVGGRVVSVDLDLLAHMPVYVRQWSCPVSWTPDDGEHKLPRKEFTWGRPSPPTRRSSALRRCAWRARADEREELRRLRRENRLLREEREILKKAAVGSTGASFRPGACPWSSLA